MTLISARHSAHDFIAKFSPSMCVTIVASLTGEMAAQSFAYHAHETADSDESCCYSWFVCHDKTLNQQCMLAQARTPMINHLKGDVCCPPVERSELEPCPTAERLDYKL